VCETAHEKRTRRRKRGEPRARSSVAPLYRRESILSVWKREMKKMCEKGNYLGWMDCRKEINVAWKDGGGKGREGGREEEPRRNVQ